MERTISVIQEAPFSGGISYEGKLRYSPEGAKLRVDGRNYQIPDNICGRVNRSEVINLDNHNERQATVLFLDIFGPVRISFPRIKQ